MSKQQRRRVVRPKEQRSPEHVRRIGRALIALAQAQLEAEAQAEAEGRTAKPEKPTLTKTNRRPRRPAGDVQ